MKNVKVKSIGEIPSYFPQNPGVEAGRHHNPGDYTLEILDVPDDVDLGAVIRALDNTALVRVEPTFRVKWERVGHGRIVMQCDD